MAINQSSSKPIDKSSLIFYEKNDLYDSIMTFITCIPNVVVDIICGYAYETKYVLYHKYILGFKKHSGIYSSICYNEYLIELVKDICYVKNAFTNELIKQQKITATTTAYVHQKIDRVLAKYPSFYIKCDKVCYGFKYMDPVFCVSFDFKKGLCYIEESNIENLNDTMDDDNYFHTTFHKNNESDHNLNDYFGYLEDDLYMEIKDKLFKKLCEIIKFKYTDLTNPHILGMIANDFLLENIYFADSNNHLHNIFFVRYEINNYTDQYDVFILCYDLDNKEIIHFYKIMNKIGKYNKNGYSFNKNYLNVSVNNYTKVNGKTYKQTHQYCVMKRVVN
jgi:hypothetical protein